MFKKLLAGGGGDLPYLSKGIARVANWLMHLGGE